MKAIYLALLLTFALMAGGCKERGTASGGTGGDDFVPEPTPSTEPPQEGSTEPPMPQYKTPMTLDPGA